jgi:hypothetical protein
VRRFRKEAFGDTSQLGCICNSVVESWFFSAVLTTGFPCSLLVGPFRNDALNAARKEGFPVGGENRPCDRAGSFALPCESLLVGKPRWKTRLVDRIKQITQRILCLRVTDPQRAIMWRWRGRRGWLHHNPPFLSRPRPRLQPRWFRHARRLRSLHHPTYPTQFQVRF